MTHWWRVVVSCGFLFGIHQWYFYLTVGAFTCCRGAASVHRSPWQLQGRRGMCCEPQTFQFGSEGLFHSFSPFDLQYPFWDLSHKPPRRGSCGSLALTPQLPCRTDAIGVTLQVDVLFGKRPGVSCASESAHCFWSKHALTFSMPHQAELLERRALEARNRIVEPFWLL